MTEHIMLSMAGIGLLTLICQWFAWWVKLPAILFLLLTGILVGPVAGWVNPDDLFGELLFPFVSLSVAVILFEGALTLRFKEIRGLESVVRNLVTVGALVTWLVTTLATYYFVDVNWPIALLFGAMMVVTGPTVIVPMLRTVRPNATISNILRWEGIVIDPIGAILAVLVFEFVLLGHNTDALEHSAFVFIKVLAVGIGFGAVSGYALGHALRRYWIPEYLYNVAALATVFTAFVASNSLVEESGLLTVTVMGILLANMDDVPVEEVLHFKESLSVLLISVLFILLAARIEFEQFNALGWGSIGVFLAIQFVARPLKVLVSSIGSSLSWRERALLCWIAPRGIVAAAVTALFALRLEQQNMAGAELLVPLAFLVIIGTVVLQSATARFLAKKLNVAEPEPKGFLLIGANLVSREIAKVLNQLGYRTLLSDSNWEHVRLARMDNLKVYYGNPVSEHADLHLDLVGIGRMLGLSRLHNLNVIASLRYRGEFGRNNIFTLQAQSKRNRSGKHAPASEHNGRYLFGSDVTHQQVHQALKNGGKLHVTQLAEKYSFDDYKTQYNGRVLPLFAVTPKEKLLLFTEGESIKPQNGWRIISLLLPEDHEELEITGTWSTELPLP